MSKGPVINDPYAMSPGDNALIVDDGSMTYGYPDPERLQQQQPIEEEMPIDGGVYPGEMGLYDDEIDHHVDTERVAGKQTRIFTVELKGKTLAQLASGKGRHNVWTMSDAIKEKLKRVIVSKNRNAATENDRIGNLSSVVFLPGTKVVKWWNNAPCGIGVDIKGFSNHHDLSDNSAHTLQFPGGQQSEKDIPLDVFNSTFTSDMYDIYEPLASIETQIVKVPSAEKPTAALIDVNTLAYRHLCNEAETGRWQGYMAPAPPLPETGDHVSVPLKIAMEVETDIAEEQKKIKNCLVDMKNDFSITFHRSDGKSWDSMKNLNVGAPIGISSAQHAKYTQNTLNTPISVGFKLHLVYGFASNQ